MYLASLKQDLAFLTSKQIFIPHKRNRNSPTITKKIQYQLRHRHRKRIFILLLHSLYTLLLKRYDSEFHEDNPVRNKYQFFMFGSFR